MASTPENRGTELDAEALESVREALPEFDDEDLVEQRPDDAPEELQQPLLPSWWA